MNTLVLTGYRPYPPAGGAPLRIWQNIQCLAHLGPVDVVSLGGDDASVPLPGVRDWHPLAMQPTRWDRLRAGAWPVRPGVYPGIDLFYTSHVVGRLRALLAERAYDLAVVEGIFLSGYIDDLRRSGCQIVFDAHNVERALHQAMVAVRSGPTPSAWRRVKDHVLGNRMAYAERLAVRSADIIWACSSGDAEDLRRLYEPGGTLVVVPNGVDVDRYASADDVERSGDDWSEEPITLLYPGVFGYLPNEDAAMRLIDQVLPAVRARGVAARVVLVGRGPTGAMQAAAHRDPDITITGEVDSIIRYLRMRCVVTLPIALGSGTRLKILEAFAAARPVVSTAKGAEGIAAEDGVHLLLGETVDAIADHVVAVWRDARLRRALCQRAHALVSAHYSWTVAADRIARSLATGQSAQLAADATRWILSTSGPDAPEGLLSDTARQVS